MAGWGIFIVIVYLAAGWLITGTVQRRLPRLLSGDLHLIAGWLPVLIRMGWRRWTR